MNRREALQSILIASSASIFLNGCQESDVVEFLKDGRLELNQNHKEYLAVISESLLPVADVSPLISPASDFILRMLNDCHGTDDINQFAIGFDQYKLLMKENQLKISGADPKRTIEMLKESISALEPQEELVYFINKTKSLSIQNLTTSEYYMIEKKEYSQIPVPYEACASA